MLIEKARLEIFSPISTERNSLPFKRILFLHVYQRNTEYSRRRHLLPRTYSEKTFPGRRSEKRKIVVNYRDEDEISE